MASRNGDPADSGAPGQPPNKWKGLTESARAIGDKYLFPTEWSARMSSDELRTLVSGMNYVPKALIFGSCAPRKDDKEHLSQYDTAVQYRSIIAAANLQPTPCTTRRPRSHSSSRPYNSTYRQVRPAAVGATTVSSHWRSICRFRTGVAVAGRALRLSSS